MKIRKTDFSGSWYPGTPAECERLIESYLKETAFTPEDGNALNGGIVPHAGWYFSGSLACNVINCLKENKPPDVVVIFGMHLGPGSRNTIMAEGSFETPFGNLDVDTDLARELIRELDFNIETPDNYVQDNTIELQLPFVKYFFGNTRILTIGASPNKKSLLMGRKVATMSDKLGLKLKVIGSTDLTHYGDNYGFTPKGRGADAVNWVKNENDRLAIEAMLKMEPQKVIDQALKYNNACCSGAAAAAIACAGSLGSEKAELMHYTTSYDKSPGRSFVGYAGIVF
jgi:MEMO1 family protein